MCQSDLRGLSRPSRPNDDPDQNVQPPCLRVLPLQRTGSGMSVLRCTLCGSDGAPTDRARTRTSVHQNLRVPGRHKVWHDTAWVAVRLRHREPQLLRGLDPLQRQLRGHHKQVPPELVLPHRPQLLRPLREKTRELLVRPDEADVHQGVRDHANHGT